jgi:CRP-like cAMP-binding protein
VGGGTSRRDGRSTTQAPEATIAIQLGDARGNAVLDGLTDDDLTPLLPTLTSSALGLGDVLHEPGEPVEVVWFPLVGVVSVVADLGEGRVVETATIGREGVVGLSVFLGADSPTERSLVQVRGRALTMSADDLRAAIAAVDGPLTAMLRRSAQAQFTLLSRNAACNRVHTVRQRAARWLLMTADRMGAPTFELTQHFLAQMLAVRRTSISDVAQFLAEDGAIAYTRGTITLTDRERLLAHACDCYAVIRAATDAALQTR